MSYTFFFSSLKKKSVNFSCNFIEHKVCAGVTIGIQYRRDGRKKQNSAAVSSIYPPQYWLSIAILVRVHIHWSYYMLEDEADVLTSNH
jgi:hypothetical protein